MSVMRPPMLTGPIGRHGNPAIVAESSAVETCAVSGAAPTRSAAAITPSEEVFTIGSRPSKVERGEVDTTGMTRKAGRALKMARAWPARAATAAPAGCAPPLLPDPLRPHVLRLGPWRKCSNHGGLGPIAVHDAAAVHLDFVRLPIRRELPEVSR